MRKSPRQNPTRKKAMISAMIKSLGIVTAAAKIAKITRDTHYEWMNTDPVYKKAIEDIEDIAIDFAETQLHKQIKNQDTTATIFYLKTKGKKRGYIEKSEIGITDKNGNDVIQVVKLPDNGRD